MMKLIKAKDELIKFCKENAIDYSVDDDCLTVKLKNCLAIIQTPNQLIPIIKKNIDKEINSMWTCRFWGSMK